MEFTLDRHHEAKSFKTDEYLLKSQSFPRVLAFREERQLVEEHVQNEKEFWIRVQCLPIDLYISRRL
jgi:hypothetical protein